MATQSNQGTSSKHEVKLAIYDLSQGMAGALSAQFLGPNHAIDIIPHTGIIAYGYEYYFGQSGIEKADPSHFRSTRGLHPIDIHHLGETHVTQHEFEEWCRQHMTNGHYAPTSYDLFHRNCNNFSHHAATEALKLPKAVPEKILQVPHRVLASPMGEFIRPMMQQMQISPSGDSSTNSLIGNQYSQSSHQQAKKHSHPAPSSDVNPWANLPSEKSEEKKEEEPSPKKKVKHVHTPTLDNYSSPMIANEKNMIDWCVNKLVESKSIASLDNTLQSRLLSNLKQLSQIFQQNNNSNANTDVIKTLLQDLMQILSFNITNSDKIYMLMITRLLVLDPTLTIEIVSNVMKHVCPVALEPTNKSTLRAIAWCVLSNILGSDLVNKNYENLEESMQEFVDAAVTCLSNDTPVEARRGAAAFLYNLACLIAMKDDEEIADLTVSIICASAEAVPDEVDVDVVKRLFATIGKIVKTKGEINEKAASLIVDLGYGDRLPQNLRVNDNDEVKSLAREMSNILTAISCEDC